MTMSNRVNLIETLEGRRLFTAAAVASSYHLIGPSAGLHASAVNPSVLNVSSPAKTRAARRDLTITVAMNLPNGAINYDTLKRDNVRLYEVKADGTKVRVDTGNAQTSGGGDTISLTPLSILKANTNYSFEINQTYSDSGSIKVKDVSGFTVTPYTLPFTTNTEVAIANPNINFSNTDAGGGISRPFTATTIGPDHKLYAADMYGEIFRWTIGSDGALSGRTLINTIRSEYGENRIITGITFAPDSTSSNLKLYVSHGQYRLGTTASTGSSVNNQADNYTGAITLLTGASLDSSRDVITNIPRSVKDHMNNQVVFDRTGDNFYFLIPSMSAMGAPDTVWGNRPENRLSAAMYKVNVDKLNNELVDTGPIDLGENSTYDPNDSASALTVYATGIRNAYDMVFHSNGHLYTATNGSSAGGNTPAGGGAPALNGVPQTEEDKLLDLKAGKYYGHPNPERDEFVLDGGNPTSGVDPFEFATASGVASGKLYPVGVQPDSNWDQPAYDLGKNVSPDGMIEYTGNAFGGALSGYMLIARYNGGSDILAVKPNSDGTISKSNIETRITGFTNLQKPLDLVEDTASGNVYVVQMPDENQDTGSIRLLKPKAVDAQGTLQTDNGTNASRISLYVAPGNRKGATKFVTLTNTGTTTMQVNRSITKFTGLQRKNFICLNLPDADFFILPGESYTFNIRGVLARGDAGPAYGNFAIGTNQPGQRYIVSPLRVFNVFEGAQPPKAKSVASVAPLVTNEASAASVVSKIKDDSPWWLSDLVA